MPNLLDLVHNVGMASVMNGTPTLSRFAERKRVVRDDEDMAGLQDSVVAKKQAINHPTGTANPLPTSQNAPRGPMNRPTERKRRIYNFAETTETILAKYANEPASLELHIHHTHYRFGSQDGIIQKNNPLIKLFFEHIASETIPPAATEIFRDSGIRFYEGCIIVKIIDFRSVPVEVVNQGGANDPRHVNAPTNIEPKSYRALLRPTPLSIWHDMLYTTDTSHGRFSDQVALNMESEILTLTVRNIDLTVPKQQNGVASNYLSPAPVPLSNRTAVPRKHRGLHEDQAQHGSEYEELMLIMDESPSAGSGKFMRLSFIEQWRKKREQRIRQQAISQHNISIGGTPDPLHSQRQQMQGGQQPQQMQQPQQPQQAIGTSTNQMPNNHGNITNFGPSPQPAAMSMGLNRSPIQSFASPSSSFNSPSLANSSPRSAASPIASGIGSPILSGPKSSTRGKGSKARGGKTAGMGRGRGKAGKTLPGSYAGKSVPMKAEAVKGRPKLKKDVK